MKTIVILVLAVCVFAAGCKSPKSVRFDETKRPATTSVEVFRDGKKPAKAYKTIAEVSYEGFGREELDGMKRLMGKAKSMGANAIILLPPKDLGFDLVPFVGSGKKYLWKAEAIVYE